MFLHALIAGVTWCVVFGKHCGRVPSQTGCWRSVLGLLRAKDTLRESVKVAPSCTQNGVHRLNPSSTYGISVTVESPSKVRTPMLSCSFQSTLLSLECVACLQDVQMMAILSVVSDIDVFVSPFGDLEIINLDHRIKMMNNTIVGNISHLRRRST